MNCGDETLIITPKSSEEFKLNKKGNCHKLSFLFPLFISIGFVLENICRSSFSGFELKLLKKLNTILMRQDEITERLSYIEAAISRAGRGNLPEIDEEVAKNLPLRFENDLREFEQQLNDGEFMENVVCYNR
jgi:hypothetical protein